jgi:thiol-disulfide isomerase/thioredoxin
MKIKLLVAMVAAGLMLWSQPVLGAEQSLAAKELRELITKVQAKLKEGDRTEDKLADELKQFDALLAKHKDEKTDDVAQILFMKAQLYSQVLDNEEKGDQLMEQLQKDFPDSKQADMVKKQTEAKKIQKSLVAGVKFPDFDEQDVEGKPLSVAAYKGKVVLVDFWATWCGPCVAELPSVLKAYEKHHGNGFEIIGISLDSDKAKLEKFTKDKKMTWQQFFDGQGWQNKLSTKYGVNSIPATYLLDGEGKIIAKDLRGEALEEAVAKALAKK